MEPLEKPLLDRPHREFHALGDSDFEHWWLTPTIKFSDEKWYFPNPTPGVRKTHSTVNWNLVLLDGSRLTDPSNAVYLLWCKKLMASLVVAPANFMKPAPATLARLPIGMKWLVSWMRINGYRMPCELSTSVVNDFFTDLPNLILSNSDDEGISEDMVHRAISLLDPLWRQRNILEKIGVASMPHDPFMRITSGSIARRIATRPGGWIKPLPDEVAIPLFNQAARFIGEPAEDVLRLLSLFTEGHLGRLGTNSGEKLLRPSRGTQRSGVYRINKSIHGFQFSCILGERSPWQPPLQALGLSKGQISPHARIRQLYEAVRDACAILIQGTSGMRISELLGITAGLDPVSGLPLAIRIEPSISGLYELFILRSILSKTERTPREVDWILGMRQIGSTEIPIAVRALSILHKLSVPWRTAANTDRLFLSLIPGSTLPHPCTRLSPMSSDKLRESMKRFIGRWVDLSALPDESAHKTEDMDLVIWREGHGVNFSTHMLRKSWANFTLAVDSRLLPAIQMQFHHLSIAMTESGYIGKNPLLVEALDCVSRQQRNLLIYEIVTGRTLVAGRMGESIESELAGLHDELQSLPTSEAWERVISFCEDSGVQIFFSPHGKCLPNRPSEMRCHESAGIPTWIRREPNHATREPSLCAGCACFILDSRHQGFWEDRYLQNWISFMQAKAAGIESSFRVVKERAEQAGRLLRKLGVDLEGLDRRVRHGLEGCNGEE